MDWLLPDFSISVAHLFLKHAVHLIDIHLGAMGLRSKSLHHFKAGDALALFHHLFDTLFYKFLFEQPRLPLHLLLPCWQRHCQSLIIRLCEGQGECFRIWVILVLAVEL